MKKKEEKKKTLFFDIDIESSLIKKDCTTFDFFVKMNLVSTVVH